MAYTCPTLVYIWYIDLFLDTCSQSMFHWMWLGSFLWCSHGHSFLQLIWAHLSVAPVKPEMK